MKIVEFSLPFRKSRKDGLNTLKGVVAYAASKNVSVEKTGKVYECWSNDDHSVVAYSTSLADLLSDVESLD